MMRLTLRTLLAYLDDLLEPAQAKELGAKIQESDIAAGLIMKIRDVIRKRRLSAPLVSGAGCDMDANVVAEYLDNTLPPESVAELEKICLESDMHLAEVAACHQILTLVLGEPVDIGTHSRERMYSLGLAASSNAGMVVAQPGEHDASLSDNRGKPSPAVSSLATADVSRKGDPDVDPLRRGDSFVGKGAALSAHPSSSPPPRTVSTGQPSGQNGQHASLSGGHSVADHPATVTANASKPTAAPHSTTPTGLGPAVKSVSSPRPPSATVPVAATIDSSANSARAGATEPFDRTIPDYLKQPPLWRRALPLAILLLIAVWVGMLLKDKQLLTGLLGNQRESIAETSNVAKDQPSPNANANAEQTAAKTDETPAAAVAQSDASQAEASEMQSEPELDVAQPPAEAAPTKQPKRTEVAVADPSVDAAPPIEPGDQANPNNPVPEAPAPDEPETGKPSRAEPQTSRNQKQKSPPADEIPEQTPPSPKTGTEVATVDPATTSDSELTPPKSTKTTKRGPATQPGTENRPQPVRYVSQDGVVLRFDDDRQGWFPLPHRQFVFAEDILAVPEPFDAQIQFGVEKHRLTAVGPTLLQVIETMDDLPLAINVERGRIVLQPAETAAGAMPARMKLALNVQGLTWILELPDIHSRCGIEIIPREPHQFEENFGSHGWSGRLIIASGTVKITTPEGKAQILKGPEVYVLAPDPSETASPAPVSVIPSWMGERKLSSAARINATHFQRTLLQDELSAHDALLSAIEDRVPEKSRLATACLGLVGDYQMMLEVLDRNEHHESREAAITALRSWINLNPINRDKIKEEIAARFFKDDVDTIYRLIWGYQEQELRGKQVSRQLVDWLSHDKLAVRECACHYIKTLTNRRLDFDARGSQTQRSAAIQQLEKILDKDGALLPPLPKGAGTAAKRN